MSDETSKPDHQPVPDGEAPVDNLLGLKLLVVFMGVLLIVAMITFFVLLFMKMRGGDEETLTTPTTISTTIVEGEDVPQSTLVLGPDEEIIDMDLDGRSLAIRLETPAGERIVIVDPYTADHRAVIEIAPSETP